MRKLREIVFRKFYKTPGRTGSAFLLSLATMNAEKDTKPFAIRRLEANQIGPFARLEMDFPEKQIEGKAEIHILTGENGTGKSTVLMLLSHCIPHDSIAARKRQWTPPMVDKSNFKISFSDGIKNNYDFRHLRSKYLKGADPYELHKALQQGGTIEEIWSTVILDYLITKNTHEHNLAFFAYSGYRKLSDSTVDSISEIQSSPFENALDFDKSTDTKTFVNWLASTITKKSLAMAKGKPGDRARAESYSLPISQIEKVIAAITGWKIEFELQESPLAILIYVNDQPLEFEQLPDGLKSIISWLGDLIMRLDRIKWSTPVPLMERNFILFLDEIEIHLHPSWQRKILPVVQQLFPNAQIFISTHSPFVVGSVDGAWVHRFVKNKDGYSEIQGMAIPSEDSNSYDYILAEIFGVSERFGIDVERDLQEFRVFKNQILNEETAIDEVRFQELIDQLMSQSREIQSIIGMELRQLSRLTNRSFA